MLTPARPRASLLRGAVLALVLSLAGILLATPAQAADEESPVPPVLLIGMTGVRWDDVTTLTTPALWSLSREGSVGLVAARSVASRSCPADGWLAVSSGTRAADVRADDGTCRTLRDPGETGEVPGWEDYVAAADAESYGAQPGFLGDVLTDVGHARDGHRSGCRDRARGRRRHPRRDARGPPGDQHRAHPRGARRPGHLPARGRRRRVVARPRLRDDRPAEHPAADRDRAG